MELDTTPAVMPQTTLIASVSSVTQENSDVNLSFIQLTKYMVFKTSVLLASTAQNLSCLLHSHPDGTTLFDLAQNNWFPSVHGINNTSMHTILLYFSFYGMNKDKKFMESTTIRRKTSQIRIWSIFLGMEKHKKRNMFKHKNSFFFPISSVIQPLALQTIQKLRAGNNSCDKHSVLISRNFQW